MKVETTLTQRTLHGGENEGVEPNKPGGFRDEIRAWRRLFESKYRDRTMIGVFIMVFQRKRPTLSFLFPQHSSYTLHTEWSGINALLYYGPTIIRSVGLQGDTVTLLVSGGIGIVQFIAVIPAIIYIDRLGASLFVALRTLVPGLTDSHE